MSSPPRRKRRGCAWCARWTTACRRWWWAIRCVCARSLAPGWQRGQVHSGRPGGSRCFGHCRCRTARRCVTHAGSRHRHRNRCPSSLAGIFESFRQLETGLSRNHGGLGLGLAVAQKLVALLDGSICGGQRIREGQRAFTVTLPFRLPIDSGARPTDREEDSRHGYWWWMTTPWPRPSPAMPCAGNPSKWNAPATAAEALEAASKTRFDVILMDLQMPGWDGFETVRTDSTIAGLSGNAHYRGDGQLLRRLSRALRPVRNAGFSSQASAHQGPGAGRGEALAQELRCG